jgi:hypothetical protein
VLGLIGGVSCPGFGVWIESLFGVFLQFCSKCVAIGCPKCSLESRAFGKYMYSVLVFLQYRYLISSLILILVTLR